MDKLIQRAVVKAGRVVRERFGKDKVHYVKSEQLWDVVTKADLLSERIILAEIAKKHGGHGIIAEESGKKNSDSDYVWIIDPIDGTMNFASEVPLFGVMAALAHRGKVILSAVYLPMQDELFFAEEGKGAYLNGRRIKCSDNRKFSRTSGTGELTVQGKPAKFMKNLLNAYKGGDLLLASFGCISGNAAYVACGRRDWCAAINGQMHDFAPTYLLLKESGCTVTDLKGKPWKLGTRGFIASNKYLHPKLLSLTKDL